VAEPPLKYLALGEDFSRGAARRQAWPSLLARRLAKKTGRLVSLESGGGDRCSTEQLIRTELGRLETLAPDFVTVLVGAADVEQGASRADYQAAVEWIYDSIAGRGLAPGRAVAVAIPAWPGAGEMQLRALEHFNVIARTEASTRGLSWVEIASVDGEVSPHPAWADAIWAAVQEAWTA
jgi:lysophospholipase L1-like esterase